MIRHIAAQCGIVWSGATPETEETAEPARSAPECLCWRLACSGLEERTRASGQRCHGLGEAEPTLLIFPVERQFLT